MQIVFANRTHHHFAGVHTDPHLQRHAVFELDLAAMSLYLLLPMERGIQRSLWMVLLRYRCTEQRKDPVAHSVGSGHSLG